MNIFRVEYWNEYLQKYEQEYYSCVLQAAQRLVDLQGCSDTRNPDITTVWLNKPEKVDHAA